MIFAFADCEVDTDRCELRRGGEVRHLEPQVFDLLVHLVTNRDRLVTKDELLDTIWGHRFVTPATLSSRVKVLRQALGDDGATQRIVQTVRGRGFRFAADVVAGSVAATSLATAATPPSSDVAPPAARGPDAPRGVLGADARSPAPPEPRRGPGTQRIRFCRARDGVRIAFSTAGSGPPLVKTANWLSHLEYDWVSPVWRHWLHELSREHTLVRYDERGCGLSDREPENQSFDAWVSDLETIVDTLELERFPLLGVSQGGAVAIAYAARHPERVSHLILYGAYAKGRGRRAEPEEVVEQEVRRTMIPLGWGRDNPAFRHFFANLFLPEGTEEQIAWFSDLQRESATADAAARLLAEFWKIEVTDLARGLQVPTLVLHASADAVVPFKSGRHLASTIPGATFVPLWGRNHLLLEDEPVWTHFVTEVRRFLGTPA